MLSQIPMKYLCLTHYGFFCRMKRKILQKLRKENRVSHPKQLSFSTLSIFQWEGEKTLVLIKHIFKDYIFQYLVVQMFCFISKSQHDEIYCDAFCLIAALGITLEKYPTIKNADGKL